MGKEAGVHLPVFSLLTCAAGSLSQFECRLVDGLEGKVLEDVFHLPRQYVILLDLWSRPTGELAAVRSLVF